MQLENLKYIDCHSHPHDEWYVKEGINPDNFLEDLKKDGGATIAIGTDYENSKKAIELALKHDNIWATIGIHPADRDDIEFDENKFDELIKMSYLDPRGSVVVGIGECGLDYFYFDKTFGKNYEQSADAKAMADKEKERQKKVFIGQIGYSLKNNLPLVLHGRPSKNTMDAYRDMLDILEKYSLPHPTSPYKGEGKPKGHAHFFVGNLEIAKRFLALGFLMSYDGPITFSKEYDEVIRFLPMENIMIETDSPYAAPMPHRGQINYQVYVKEVAKRIAELKSMSVEEVMEITKQNAIKLFGLK